jgi:hypothetical protein
MVTSLAKPAANIIYPIRLLKTMFVGISHTGNDSRKYILNRVTFELRKKQLNSTNTPLEEDYNNQEIIIFSFFAIKLICELQLFYRINYIFNLQCKLEQ